MVWQVLSHAQDVKVVLWSDSVKRLICTTDRGYQVIKEFVQHRRQQQARHEHSPSLPPAAAAASSAIAPMQLSS